uniref:Uncharacterized protein n=1 Tax=Sparus aurata TaxID=8175 RepID=A0A671WUI8_SPAAU
MILKRAFSKNPLASNTFFGLFLTGLEKLVEYEFVCPCNPENNARFAAAFVVVPALLAFLLMTNFRAWQSVKCSKECLKNLLYSSGITMVWFTLVFMDGNYFVCAMTNWSGTYESVPKGAPRKWCKPLYDGKCGEPSKHT